MDGKTSVLDKTVVGLVDYDISGAIFRSWRNFLLGTFFGLSRRQFRRSPSRGCLLYLSWQYVGRLNYYIWDIEVVKSGKDAIVGEMESFDNTNQAVPMMTPVSLESYAKTLNIY